MDLKENKIDLGEIIHPGKKDFDNFWENYNDPCSYEDPNAVYQ